MPTSACGWATRAAGTASPQAPRPRSAARAGRAWWWSTTGRGQAPENQGTVGGEGASRTLPNPQERNGRSLLTRLVFAPGADQRFRLTVEGNEYRADTDMLTAHGVQPLTRATNFLVAGADHQTRARVSFGHEMDAVGAGFADSLDWQVYRQDSETTQDTVEVRRTAGGTNERREREFNFDQRLHGLQLNLRKEFETGSVRHALAYGLADRRYFDLGGMGLVSRDSATLDRYTAAGRNVSLSVAFAW